jgi:hypothetical protein
VLTLVDTDEPGFYRVAVTVETNGSPAVHGAFPVNVDPAESDLKHLEPARMAALAAGAGGTVAMKAARRRVELWHALGVGLLLLLLGEALLLRRK